jgi:hypothetical protein
MPARTPSISTHLANLPRMSINALSIPARGLPSPSRLLGSFEQWAEWCRDPLLALGCRDSVERIDAVKSIRVRSSTCSTLGMCNGERPVKASALAGARLGRSARTGPPIRRGVAAAARGHAGRWLRPDAPWVAATYDHGDRPTTATLMPTVSHARRRLEVSVSFDPRPPRRPS